MQRVEVTIPYVNMNLWGISGIIAYRKLYIPFFKAPLAYIVYKMIEKDKYYALLEFILAGVFLTLPLDLAWCVKFLLPNEVSSLIFVVVILTAPLWLRYTLYFFRIVARKMPVVWERNPEIDMRYIYVLSETTSLLNL